jgi:hypothetical protein
VLMMIISLHTCRIINNIEAGIYGIVERPSDPCDEWSGSIPGAAAACSRILRRLILPSIDRTAPDMISPSINQDAKPHLSR